MSEICKETSHVWRHYPAVPPLLQCTRCKALGSQEGDAVVLLRCVECGGVATDRGIRSRAIVPVCESCEARPCDVHVSCSPYRGRSDWYSCDRCALLCIKDASGAFQSVACTTCGEPAVMLDDGTQTPSCFDHFVGVILL